MRRFLSQNLELIMQIIGLDCIVTIDCCLGANYLHSDIDNLIWWILTSDRH